MDQEQLRTDYSAEEEEKKACGFFFVMAWVWPAVPQPPAGARGRGFEINKKINNKWRKTGTLLLKKKISASELAAENFNHRLMRTAHFKPSKKKNLSISRSNIQILGTRTKETYSIMLCAVFLKKKNLSQSKEDLWDIYSSTQKEKWQIVWWKWQHTYCSTPTPSEKSPS